MRFAYYDRLTPSRQATYRQSDAITALVLPSDAVVAAPVLAIREGLALDRRAAVQAGSRNLIDALVAAFAVPAVEMRVLVVRPSDHEGELHGLYEPDEGRPTARITVWMRTAQRRQAVAFRSFLRTVVHEFAHHLDYELFKLPETFHTEGFYKRESSLANALFAAAGEPTKPGPVAARPDLR